MEFPAVTVCNLNRLRSYQLGGTHYKNLVELDEIYRCKIDMYLDRESDGESESTEGCPQRIEDHDNRSREHPDDQEDQFSEFGPGDDGEEPFKVHCVFSTSRGH